MANHSHLNPLRGLQALGQSVWLDVLRRGMLTSGELRRFVEEDGLHGLTGNLAVREKAVAGSHDYDDLIRQWARQGKTSSEIAELLEVEDVQAAADVFQPAYERTEGRDGYCCLALPPQLADDTAGTIMEAQRLWGLVGRPNVMITVPATREGLPAIRELIRRGIHVHVTLVFGLDRYREVVDAYIAGLEARAAAGEPLRPVASVASVSLSRIDTVVDSLLEDALRSGRLDPVAAPELRGRAAVATAKVLSQASTEVARSPRFQALAERGARPQRLLWTGTSTTTPGRSDVMYVDSLIGPETVVALTLETLHAYRDHGNPASRLADDAEGARRTLTRLAESGIDLHALAVRLERESLERMVAVHGRLLMAVEEKRSTVLAGPSTREELALGEDLEAVRGRLEEVDRDQVPARLWRRDPSLWTRDPQERTTVLHGLGWLHVAEKMEENLDALLRFAAEVRAAGLRHVVHMGMGGSSLAPLVIARTFTPGPDGLPLTVLDTTDPATILSIHRRVPLAETLFIVASKSGTTAEPVAFGEYFYAAVRAAAGDRAGGQFVAITDPGTPLAAEAHRRGYRRVFENFPDIGGRYSALSYFGLVPAVLAGVDVFGLLDRAQRMAQACASCVPAPHNPGVALGAMLGELARRGRDKVTLLVTDPIAALGLWLEQLLAESTGKQGTGLLPVADEPVGDPAVYGRDRVFVVITLSGAPDPTLKGTARELAAAGHPVVTLALRDPLDLGQEFFRWEVATAVAGSILGINAFDQPNVQESKANTDRLLEAVREGRGLPEPDPTLVEGPLRVYTDGDERSLVEALARFIARARPGDYVALQAYLPETPPLHAALQEIRRTLRDGTRLATTLGYGPRYLHSTGQYHKGGPNTGLFLQITGDDGEDAAIPGSSYTFGVFKRAQALGDLEALRRHGRRIMRVHLSGDPLKALRHLQDAIAAALPRSQ